MSLRDKEKKAAYDREYREKNIEKIKAGHKKYYEKNKEKTLVRGKKNKNKWREINLRIIEEGRWDEHIKELYPTGMKSCSIENGKERSINHFARFISGPYGKQSYCIGCEAYKKAKNKHKKRFSDQEMISREDFLELFYAEECYLCGRSNEYSSVDRKESNIKV